MCVLTVIFMFNHFPYEMIMYYNYFSKGHNVGTTFCPLLSSPMADFNIVAYGEKSQDRAICSL